MSYRTPLEARIAKKTTRAITDFNLIEDGDRIMVGLSGGKDSWALLQILDELRVRAPIHFTLVAVNVDSGYKGYKHDVIATVAHLRKDGWIGQKQVWFAFHFTGQDSEVDLDVHGEKEFDAWRWERLDATPPLAAPFKRAVYDKVAKAFARFAERQSSDLPNGAG